MKSRAEVTLETKLHRLARQRASELGVSLAEYMRRLIDRDLANSRATADVTCAFDLGTSGSRDIRRDKDAMIANAFERRRKPHRS